MSLNITGKEINRIDIALLIACLIVLGGLVAVSLVAYDIHRTRTAQAAQERTEIEQTKAANAKLADEQRKAEHQADISRLVSICVLSQERFDKLTPKQQATETRPDCTVQ